MKKGQWNLPNDDMLGFVKIPTGKFVMGSTEKQVEEAIADLSAKVCDKERVTILPGLVKFFKTEAPQREVNLSEYYIARYPVTVAQFRSFIEDSNYSDATGWDRPPRYDDHPVVNVLWHDAAAYCEWLTEKLKGQGWKIQLPTETQWEKAARGTDGRIYPWGNEADPKKANYFATGVADSVEVTGFPEGNSPYGIQNMSGNTWDWCKSDADLFYIRRGGSWGNLSVLCRSACRYGTPNDNLRFYRLGFRCAGEKI